MSDKPVSMSRYVAFRYVSAGKRSHLVSFMSAISVFGLALGVAILIIVLSVMNGFDNEMRQNILGIVPHITISSEENLRASGWDEIAAISSQHPEVLSTAPLIQAMGVVATPAANRGVLVNGVDVAAESASSAIGNFMQAGSIGALQDANWGIVIGETLAERLAVSIGDKIKLFSPSIAINPLTLLPTFRDFELVGVYKVGSEDLDSNLVMINLAAARALFRLRSPYNALTIRTSDVLQAQRIRSELSATLPAELGIQSWTATLGSIYQNIQFSRSIISFMLWLLIGVAAFNLVVSLIMIVRDKRGDIAILRTLGASPRTINSIFMWQGCFIGLLGTVIGVALGIAGSLKVSQLAIFIEERFSIQLLNAEVYPIDFLPSQLSMVDVAMVSFGVLVLSLLATLYPAKRAASIQPAEALRQE